MGCGGCSGKVPAQTVPPVGRSNFGAHPIGRVQHAPTVQRHKNAFATATSKGFSVAVRLHYSAATARARISLIQSNYLLVKGKLLIGLVEHFTACRVSASPSPRQEAPLANARLVFDIR